MALSETLETDKLGTARRERIEPITGATFLLTREKIRIRRRPGRVHVVTLLRLPHEP